LKTKLNTVISAQTSFNQSAIADHYNELDSFYRELWGEHLHHGFWIGGRDSSEIAVRRLVDIVVQKAQIKPGDEVIDIGCGYGAPARQLADEHGAKVTAITVSPVQLAYAQNLCSGPNPRYLLADWLSADLPTRNYRAAIAIESTEHMPRAEFFRRAFQILPVGGRLVVCAWLSRAQASSIEIQLLLQPICDEGRIPQLPTLAELIEAGEASGFAVIDARDCTQAVSRTWGIILQRMIRHLLTDARYRAFLVDRQRRNRIFALTVLRIWLAYKMGAMRYGILTLSRPG
jgi:tocopherol O-methyltransferase